MTNIITSKNAKKVIVDHNGFNEFFAHVELAEGFSVIFARAYTWAELVSHPDFYTYVHVWVLPLESTNNAKQKRNKELSTSKSDV